MKSENLDKGRNGVKFNEDVKKPSEGKTGEIKYQKNRKFLPLYTQYSF